MKRFIYRLLGIACHNEPWGCANKRHLTVLTSNYCKWCWNRGLISKLRYETWTKS